MTDTTPTTLYHSSSHLHRSFDSVPEVPSEDDIEQQLPRRKNTSQFPCTNQGQTQAHSSDEWTSDIEVLIKHWKDQVEKLSHVHQESGYINKTRYYRLAIPSILLPFVMTLASQNIDGGNIQNPATIVNGVAFAVTSILSALSLFFNYNQLSEGHFQTSARYTDISNRIDSELARRRRFRTPSDVFITETKARIESLGDTSPTLPGTWC